MRLRWRLLLAALGVGVIAFEGTYISPEPGLGFGIGFVLLIVAVLAGWDYPRLVDDAFDPSDDREALEVLEVAGIRQDRGIILVPREGGYPPRVWEAIDYLCAEWDYGWEWVA